MLLDFFRLGMNNLKRRKVRAWLTMIGIFIGIAAVVSLISLGQGLQTAITGQFASMGTDTLTIQNAETGFGPPGSTAITKLNEHDLKVIEGVNGVEFAIPRYIRTTRAEFNGVVQFTTITNVPENQAEREWLYSSGGLKTEEGRLLKSGDNGKIVVGKNFGDNDVFGKPIVVGKRIMVEGKEFEIVGILKTSSNFFLNNAILMMENDLKEVMETGEEMDMIIVKVQNPDLAEATADRIRKTLRNDRNEKIGEEDFSVQTPLEALKAVDTILNAIQIVVVGIASISLIVGGIGIANTMYTSVLERRQEIGTMKAIGAKNSDILTVFLIESGLLGLAGGIIGVLIGVSISYSVSAGANVYFGSDIIAFNLPVYLIIFAIAFSFSLGVIFGAIPSYQASRLKPVDALRG
jgi:putative ABC transport system permease protein